MKNNQINYFLYQSIILTFANDAYVYYICPSQKFSKRSE